jgi:magnesium-transporting ATPase (P-type)
VDHDRIDPEPAVTRAQAPSWDLEEILGWSLLAALLLLVVAYVAAAIVETGASPQENALEVNTYYATEWASPYFVLFPLAALAIAWWQLRRWGPSLASHGETAEDEEGEAEAGFVHLLRARTTVTASLVALLVIVCAAIGVVVSSLLLFPSSAATGSQVWPSEAETLASAAAALLLCLIGVAVALRLWGEASARLADDTEDGVAELDEPEAAPVTD